MENVDVVVELKEVKVDDMKYYLIAAVGVHHLLANFLAQSARPS
jgi:hypothetical protein